MEQEAMDLLLKAVGSKIEIRTYDGEHQIAIIPHDYKIEDLKRFLPEPPRVKQRIEHLTEASFCQYVKDFRLEDGADLQTSVFADERAGHYSAVFDYHSTTPIGVGIRGDCDHSATYLCPESEEWKTWMGFSAKLMPQEEFARFIETWLGDIIKPPAAELLEVALTLQVKKGVQFSSQMRLSDGQHQFRYDETIRGSTTAGDIKIPDAFTINIPVFLGGEKQKIEAKLRYRLDGPKLTIGYEVLRPNQIRNDAISQVTARIRKALDKTPFYTAKSPL